MSSFAFVVSAAEPGTNSAAGLQAGTNASAGALVPVPEEIKLNAEFALLKELASRHSQRAEEAAKLNQPEKSRWESELARELTGRVERTAGTLEEMVRRRLAGEQGRGMTNAPPEADPNEAAFFSRLDTHVWKVEQEIRAAEEATRALAAQLQTNNTPDDVFRISSEVQQNNALIRSLERERSTLELQELQYRALRPSPGR